VEHEGLLRATYEAFNERDIDGVLRRVAADVDWPNGSEGGRVHGREEVRDYCRRQWSEIDPHVDHVAHTRRPDGRVAAAVIQAVRRLDGTLLS
jgi:hypothetical protein